ncbi:MAG: HEPN domain-containing protein [Phycisphaerae bacterium]|nr:HEPN domain-containing protein [Phycisphaerae bacterium]
MVEDLHAMVKGWLIKAKHDLESAHRLAAGDDPLLDTAIYHCQQAAEKAVKGFLVLRGQSFGKTHDIRILIEQAEKSEPGFALWQEAAARLTPYAAAFRYPGDFVAPDREEYSLALQAAENLVAYIHSLLPLDLVEGL